MSILSRINNIHHKLGSVIRFRPSIKQIYNHIKYIFSPQKTILKYRPLWLLIYVSDLCNLKCKMCPHHTTGNSSEFEFKKPLYEFFSVDLFEKIMIRFPETTLVMLAGVGEPLLNPDFLKIIQIAKDYKKQINLVTNGVLLSKKIIENIINNGYFKKISISLNAPNATEYSKICNVSGKTYEIVLNNIKNLVAAKKESNAKFEIAVSAVCSNEFIPKIKEFLLAVDSLGVDQIELHNYIDFSIHEQVDQWSPISNNEQTLSVFDNLRTTLSTLKCRVVLPKIRNTAGFKRHCEWFFKNLAFDSRGNMGSCGRVINPDISYGNIEDTGDLWNNEYMVRMREKYINHREVLPSYCYKCIENYENSK